MNIMHVLVDMVKISIVVHCAPKIILNEIEEDQSGDLITIGHVWNELRILIQIDCLVASDEHLVGHFLIVEDFMGDCPAATLSVPAR
jgi:hypothetical protein